MFNPVEQNLTNHDLGHWQSESWPVRVWPGSPWVYPEPVWEPVLTPLVYSLHPKIIWTLSIFVYLKLIWTLHVWHDPIILNNFSNFYPTKGLFSPTYFQFSSVQFNSIQFSSALDNTFTLTYHLWILVQFSSIQFSSIQFNSVILCRREHVLTLINF